MPTLSVARCTKFRPVDKAVYSVIIATYFEVLNLADLNLLLFLFKKKYMGICFYIYVRTRPGMPYLPYYYGAVDLIKTRSKFSTAYFKF